MDTLIKKIIVILLLTFTLVGCKKYPEGGRISGWQGVEGKISGQYNIRELMVNNIDSTSSFVGNPCYCSSSYKVSFLKDEISGRTSRIIKSDCGTFPENSWKVSDNRKQLIITSVNTISRGEL